MHRRAAVARAGAARSPLHGRRVAQPGPGTLFARSTWLVGMRLALAEPFARLAAAPLDLPVLGVAGLVRQNVLQAAHVRRSPLGHMGNAKLGRMVPWFSIFFARGRKKGVFVAGADAGIAGIPRP